MSRPVRYLSLLIAIIVMVAAVTGIAMWSVDADFDKVEPGLFIDGEQVENPGAVMVIGEKEVPFSIYRHYFLMFRSYFESYYGKDFYQNDLDGDKVVALKGAVETELKNAYAWLIIAEQENITLNDEDLAKINQTLEDQRTEFGANFDQKMQDMFYLDEANYLEIAKMQALVEKARTEYTEKFTAENEKTLMGQADEAFLKDNIRAKHILIKPDPEIADPAEAKKEALATSEQILAQIRASEDPEKTFDQLREEYSQDVGEDGSINQPEGYIFGEGQMAQPFYEGAKALKENEISEPIWNEQENYSGYHIIMRLPITEEELAANRETWVQQQISTKVDEKISDLLQSLTITFADFYDKITIDSIK